MKNSKVLFQELTRRIAAHESSDEAEAIAALILYHLFSLSRTDFLAEKNIAITADDERRIDTIVQRLLAGEPVQYVLGETEFYGRTFIVNPFVLIPRPETEELVRLVIAHLRRATHAVEVLDVGTGSGCIPITIAREIANARVHALDISEGALTVARQNGERHHASVSWLKHDVLRQPLPYRNLDAIVSNPPYIPTAEQPSMRPNVIQHEPHLALFVPDDEPLRFYEVLAKKAPASLRAKGLLAVEINERFGAGVAQLFLENGFREVSVIKDLSGKDRIVKGVYG